MPPPVSAKKIGGVPAYKLARKNLPVDLQPVPIDVTRLEVLQTPLPKLEILLTVTAGGYIRSIAHDLGQKLGCGAVLSGLRRLASGAYSVGQARTLEALGDLAGQGRLQEAIIPAGELLPHFPSEYVDDSVVAQIRQGRDFRTSPFVVSPGAPYVKALSRSGELIAIGSMKMPNVYHPGTVL
jgi:tRNA pseudouridine55 synthase